MPHSKSFFSDFGLNFLLKKHKIFLIWLHISFAISFIASGYLIYNSPDDYLQGVYAKIMYVHIPAAWLSILLYVLLSIFSISYLTSRNTLFYFAAKSVAPIGLTFSIITLVTGSIWGYPTWGTWWVWDARLTSMLVLALIYISYIIVATSFSNEIKCASVSSIFAIVGLINIPIIKFSVNLWSTLHQGNSILKSGGTSIHISMLKPLISSGLTSIFFSCIIFILILKCGQQFRKLNKLQYLK